MGGKAARLRGEEGVSLVEVLVAATILTLVLVPLIDFAAYVYSGQAYQRQLRAVLATATLEEIQNKAFRTPNWPELGIENPSVGKLTFKVRWETTPVFDGDFEGEQVRLAEVRVQCTNCVDMSELKVVTYIAKLPDGSTSAKVRP